VAASNYAYTILFQSKARMPSLQQKECESSGCIHLKGANKCEECKLILFICRCTICSYASEKFHAGVRRHRERKVCIGTNYSGAIKYACGFARVTSVSIHHTEIKCMSLAVVSIF
jgi:hypothetical protein